MYFWQKAEKQLTHEPCEVLLALRELMLYHTIVPRSYMRLGIPAKISVLDLISSCSQLTSAECSTGGLHSTLWRPYEQGRGSWGWHSTEKLYGCVHPSNVLNRPQTSQAHNYLGISVKSIGRQAGRRQWRMCEWQAVFVRLSALSLSLHTYGFVQLWAINSRKSRVPLPTHLSHAYWHSIHDTAEHSFK